MIRMIFKGRAVVDESFGCGEQTMLTRGGDIHERKDSVEVEHGENLRRPIYEYLDVRQEGASRSRR